RVCAVRRVQAVGRRPRAGHVGATRVSANEVHPRGPGADERPEVLVADPRAVVVAARVASQRLTAATRASRCDSFRSVVLRVDHGLDHRAQLTATAGSPACTLDLLRGGGDFCRVVSAPTLMNSFFLHDALAWLSC